MSNKFDVIIIGSGIGGLVCGSFLAKAGKKVLIIEQHSQPGGYCTSFKYKGFIFDTAIPFLGSLRTSGRLKRIIISLGLNAKIKFIRFDPQATVIIPNRTVFFKNDIKKTINQLQMQFPEESENISAFFNLLKNENVIKDYLFLSKNTFQNILDKYFQDKELKIIFSVLLLSLGLLPSKISALAGSIFYRENVLDGGYYPVGGIQNFTNTFVDTYKEYGGKILLSSKVKKIIIKNNKALGIILPDNLKFESKYVVSNIDATQTFYKLIGRKYLKRKFLLKIERMKPSLSSFMVYLGLNKKLEPKFKIYNSAWYISEADLKKDFPDINKEEVMFINKSFLYSVPSLYDNSLTPEGCECIKMRIPIPFKNKSYWERNKNRLMEVLIEGLKILIPNFSKYIVIKKCATPYDFYRFTLNTKGAAIGWSYIISQFGKNRLDPITPINNLFLVGHWTRPGAGVAAVAQSGYYAAKQILSKQ